MDEYNKSYYNVVDRLRFEPSMVEKVVANLGTSRQVCKTVPQSQIDSQKNIKKRERFQEMTTSTFSAEIQLMKYITIF